MTINRGLFVPINTGNVGTTEVEARQALAGLIETRDGVNPRNGLLHPSGPVVVTGTAATGTMGYSIGPFQAVVNRVLGEGVYLFSAGGVSGVNTTAAPVSGSRIDVIWVKQNDQSKGDADNLAVPGVTQGASSSTPVAPAIPTGALELAQATILSTTTATNTASIVQTWRYTALRGNPIPVRNATERDELSPVADMAVQRIDLGPTAVETRSGGGSWQLSGVTQHAEFTGSTVNTANTLWGTGALTLDGPASKNPEFATATGLDRVSLPPGSYEISVRYGLSVAASGVSWGSVANDANTLTFASDDIAPGYATANPSVTIYIGTTQNIRFPFISGASGTLTSRVRITKRG